MVCMTTNSGIETVSIEGLPANYAVHFDDILQKSVYFFRNMCSTSSILSVHRLAVIVLSIVLAVEGNIQYQFQPLADVSITFSSTECRIWIHNTHSVNFHQCFLKQKKISVCERFHFDFINLVCHWTGAVFLKRRNWQTKTWQNSTISRVINHH